MDYKEIFDRPSYIITAIAFFISFIIFSKDTFEIAKSMSAAAMLAGLVFLSYIMIRCIYLSLRK